ncbi:lamin tail domain-containing protein [Psychroserpens mesophilus]|uniref:lamin tail domain-containing protein n=1 Tax=Psychroserpens mesophilus TaxID=325473 RepID=UPI003D660FFE
MKRNYVHIIITFLCGILFSYGQGSETFTSLNATTGGYTNNSYIGDNGLTWTYANARTVNSTYNITGRSIGFAGTTPITKTVTTTTDANGVGDLTYSVRSYFTGGDEADRTMEVYVNGTLYDSYTLGSMGTVYTRSFTANETGAVSIEFRAPSGTRQIVLDDVSWTAAALPTNTQVEFVSASSTLLENGTSIAICVSIINPDPAPSSVDITLDPSSNATNGIDYDDGTSTAISFPQTLNFPSNSATNECFTIFISNDDLIYEGDEIIVLNLTNPTGGNAISLGSNTQHILTILDNETPVIADVIITEIMYNSTGTDDEWIEICNTTGISQVLNDYTIEVNGNTRFVFPSTGTVINSGDCITIALGDSGDATFNPDCPFTPDYANASSSGTLPNSSANISIVANDVGTTIVDTVTYNSSDGGNTTSLHVTDDSLDNSDTGTNWQNVIDGGSPGFNTLISQCSTLQPEINVEGDINTFPDISNNDITPSFFDNTQFSSLELGTPETKSFRIQNIGTADLTISNIEIVGVDAIDFSVTLPSGLPIVITDISTNPANLIVFDVTFTPSVVGVRNATVRITNDDPTGSENIFEFAISGNGFCTTAVNLVTPLSGPDNTIVTISGSDLGGSTSVNFAGSSIAHTVISPTEIEITIPDGSISGNIVVTNNIGCQTSDLFTVIDNTISSCEGTAGLTPSDLFISEVTDAPVGAHTYIEIFNGTGAPVNLADYEIRVHNNGSNNAGGAIVDLSAAYTMPDNSVYVVAIGGTSATDPEGGYIANEFSAIPALNGNDNIRLYTDDGTTEVWIDVWGDTAGAQFTTTTSGYTYRRKNTGITVPRIASWYAPDNMQNDWDALTPVDYSDIGLFDFSTGIPPTITLEPVAPANACDTAASFTVAATEGFTGGLSLAYQWFVSIPGIDGWSALSDDATYSGATTATLSISNTVGLYNYQYYCQVRENLNTCFTASEAVRIKTQSTSWVSPGNWSNGTPDINTIATIDFNYDTSTHGDISACSLTINSGTLNIRNGGYVEINYDLTVNSTLDIETEGSLVMIDDTGIVTNNGTTNVRKTTTDMETYDYTYWSSPVDYSISGTSIQTVLGGFFTTKIYSFNTSLFFDVQDPDGVPGADGFDDNQDSWTNHYGFMEPGIGYAAMSNGVGVHQRNITFNGTLNTGTIPVSVALSQNNAATNDDWNLLGNPYPSAISADDFVAHNTNLDGTVYLWTHEDDILITNPGPDAYNFSSNDYAMYNTVGGVGTASTGTVVSNIPTGYIASGQGFFIDAVTAGTVEFTNAMRSRTYSNNDFFRNSESNSSAYTEKDRMWINLTNPDGAFSQILVGYMEDGTLGKDRLYDGIRLESSNYIDFYSKDETNLYKYGIQGRPTFTLDDVIPIGYDSEILGELTISLYQTEGILSEVTVYLKDHVLGTIHDLTTSDYTFSTENGNFSNRFEIVYQSEALSIGENEINSNQLSIIELQNGSVKFSVGNNLIIDTIEIMDLLGRTLYNFKGHNSTEIFELHSLSQTAYVAKVTLSNGQTIVKRAIKRH